METGNEIKEFFSEVFVEGNLGIRVNVEDLNGRIFELNSNNTKKVIGRSGIADFKRDLNGNFSLELTEKGVLVQDLTKRLNCGLEKESEQIFKGLIIMEKNTVFTFDNEGEDWIVKCPSKTIKLQEGLINEDLEFKKQVRINQGLTLEQVPYWAVHGKFLRYLHSETTLNNTLSPKLLISFESLKKGQTIKYDSNVFKLQLNRS